MSITKISVKTMQTSKSKAPSHAVFRCLDIGIILCIGLFPVLHVVSLRLILLLVFIGCILRAALRCSEPFERPSYQHLAVFQFAAFFALNAALFTPLERTPEHFRAVALEAWSVTILGLGMFWYYLSDGRDLAAHWIKWLPIGLIGSFIIMSVIYVLEGNAGDSRVKALAPNSLGPPTWFLVLTVISFSGYANLGKHARVIRFAVLAMSAIMAIYAGGRFALLAWALSMIFISWYIVRLSPRDQRMWQSIILSGFLILVVVCLFALDQLTAGTTSERVRETLKGFEDEESLTFFRLELWNVALEVIKLHFPWGAGQINERSLISERLLYHDWLRAHQTYLSYMICGGVLGLVSGLIFQLAPLGLIAKKRRRDMVPAFAGLVGVTALNGFTDSIFQSYVSVQIYIVLTLMLRTWRPEGTAS